MSDKTDGDALEGEIAAYESLVRFRMTECLGIADASEQACQDKFDAFVGKCREELKTTIAGLERKMEETWSESIEQFKAAVLRELGEKLSVGMEAFSIVSKAMDELKSKATLLQLFKAKMDALDTKAAGMDARAAFRTEFQTVERIAALDAMIGEQSRRLFAGLEMPFNDEARKDEFGRDSGSYLFKPIVRQPENLDLIGAQLWRKDTAVVAKTPVLLDRRKLNFIFFAVDAADGTVGVSAQEKASLKRQMSAIAANMMYQELLRCSGDGGLEVLGFAVDSVIAGWNDIITREKSLPVKVSVYKSAEDFGRALAFIDCLPKKARGDGHRSYLAVLFLPAPVPKGILDLVEKLALVNVNGVSTLVIAPAEAQPEIAKFAGQFGTPLLHPEGTEAEMRYQAGILSVRSSGMWEFVPWDHVDDESGKAKLDLKLQTIQALITPPRPLEEGTVCVPIGHLHGAPFCLSYDSGDSSIYIHGGVGSGKTVTEWSFLVNIAESYTPDEAVFYFIDFNKIGEVFIDIVDLPHCKVCLGGAGMASFEILAIEIKHELDRRSGLFAQLRVADISSYNSYRKKNPNLKLEPLPKIFVVFDEARELSHIPVEFRDLRDLLRKAFSTGRSRGVYFVLADQEPMGEHPDLKNLIAYDLQLSLDKSETRITPRLLHLSSNAEIVLDDVVKDEMTKDEFEAAQKRRTAALMDKYGSWPAGDVFQPQLKLIGGDSLLTLENMPGAVEIVRRVVARTTSDELHICLGMSFGVIGRDGKISKTFRDPAEMSFTKSGRRSSDPDSDKHLLVFDSSGTDINKAFWKLFEQSVLLQDKAKVRLRVFDPAGKLLPLFHDSSVEEISDPGKLLQIAKGFQDSGGDADFEFTIVNLEQFSSAYNEWCHDPNGASRVGRMDDPPADSPPDVNVEVSLEDWTAMLENYKESAASWEQDEKTVADPADARPRMDWPPTPSEYVEAIAAAISARRHAGTAHYFIVQSSSSYEWVGGNSSDEIKRLRWEKILENVSCLRAVRLAPHEVPPSLHMLKRTETEMGVSGRYYHSIGTQEIAPHETFIPYDSSIFGQTLARGEERLP